MVACWSDRKQKTLECLFMDKGSEGRLDSVKLLSWKPTPSAFFSLSDSCESPGFLNSMMLYLTLSKSVFPFCSVSKTES